MRILSHETQVRLGAFAADFLRFIPDLVEDFGDLGFVGGDEMGDFSVVGAF